MEKSEEQGVNEAAASKDEALKNLDEKFKQEQAKILAQMAAGGGLTRPEKKDEKDDQPMSTQDGTSAEQEEVKDGKDSEQPTEKKEYTDDEKLVLQAKMYKEEGNVHFKRKDYKKAISKYCRVYLFLKTTVDELTAKKRGGDDAAGGDPAMAMLAKRQKSTLTKEQKNEVKELQATTYLNLAVCFHLEKKYDKAIDNAKKSIELNPTIKGFYRLG